MIARAVVASPVVELDDPVVFGERSFPRGCELRIEAPAPWGSGVELQPLVERLEAFPDARSWSVRLQRPLLRLPAGDAALLTRALEQVAGEPAEHVDGYRAKARSAG